MTASDNYNNYKSPYKPTYNATNIELRYFFLKKLH